MKRLIDQGRVPYGGQYKLNRREAGIVGIGYTFDTLEASVMNYRTANSLPIGLGFRDELEQCICEEYPQECHETDPVAPPKPRRLKLREVVYGTQVMMSFIADGMKVVEDAEANRRGSICAACKQNVPYAKPCGGPCGVLKKMVKTITGNRVTEHEAALSACAICGCILSAAIWLPVEIQLNPLPDNVKKQFEAIPRCWKRLNDKT